MTKVIAINGTNTAYLSLGSNVGDRVGSLRSAIEKLKTLGTVVAVSSFYETEPVEYTSQPWFLNCVVELETGLLPQQLLDEILNLERKMGRTRTEKKGPRTIDIDILLFGEEQINSANLSIPHPAMQERRFVLEPLSEIAPQAVHPGLMKTVSKLKEELNPGQLVKRLTEQ